ncbi:MAG: saccharopine dehydrogenase C-terminal domain-containing protein [Acidobacteriota bacterium]
MQKILVLGAGRSSPFLIRRLLERSPERDWFVTVGDVDPELAARRVDGHPRGTAIRFDVNDAGLRATQIEKADLVINMLAPRFQDLVAWDCLAHGRHMLSASYRDSAVRAMEQDAHRQGVLLLCELGLDPGIDHMSAMALIDRLRAEGGRIRRFCSYGGGLPAPETDPNPLGYVITWNPRNVAMAGENGAQYMEDGAVRLVPFHHVFHHTWPVEVEGVGTLEAYPNRDSMPYMESFGLHEVETMIRGSLRYPGWSETWAEIVRLGLPNEQLHVPRLGERSYRELLEMFLPRGHDGQRIEERIARFLGISPTGRILSNLAWLGLFSEEPIGGAATTPAAVLADLLTRRMPLPPDGRDVVILQHELSVEFPHTDRPPERHVSTLVTRGEGRSTAMARAVGLPTAIAAELVLAGEIALTGSQIPTHSSIYTPVLRELAREGLRFVERMDGTAGGRDHDRAEDPVTA